MIELSLEEPQLRIQKNEAEYKNTNNSMQTPKSVSVIDASNVFWTSSDDCINRILGTSTFHKRKMPKSSSSSRDSLQKGSYYDDLSVNVIINLIQELNSEITIILNVLFTLKIRNVLLRVPLGPNTHATWRYPKN
jgi:hypothetical protein